MWNWCDIFFIEIVTSIGLKSAIEVLKSWQPDVTVGFFVFSVVWSFTKAARTALKIKNETKQSMPFLSKLFLALRYLLVFLIRIVSIVSYFAPFIGLWDILNHYQAETIPLDRKTFQLLNGTVDQQYHYWNTLTNKTDKIPISSLFRSDYSDPKHSLPPLTTRTRVVRICFFSGQTKEAVDFGW